jgi:predicted type IV restriction endonuclease
MSLVLDKQTKKALNDARLMIEDAIRTDLNEAETGRRIERMFDSLMGYDVFKHITREHAVHAVGDSDYCDFAIIIDDNKTTPTILIEIKKASMELAQKHLKQTASYAINVGCEWAILTNGKVWQLYHISFGQPPQTILIDTWDLIESPPAILAEKFALVGYRNVKKGGLKQIWDKSNVLTNENVLRMILSEESIAMIRRGIKRKTDVTVSPEDIVSAIRHVLNEAALGEMDKIKICLPNKKTTPKKLTNRTINTCDPSEQVVDTRQQVQSQAIDNK